MEYIRDRVGDSKFDAEVEVRGDEVLVVNGDKSLLWVLDSIEVGKPLPVEQTILYSAPGEVLADFSKLPQL